MNKKLFGTVVSIVLIVVGCVVSYFAKFEVAQITAFAVTMFGAGLAVNQLWTGRNKEAKTALVILGICLIGIASFIAGLFAFLQLEQVKSLIGLIFSVVVFIAGLIVTLIGNKVKQDN